MPDQDLLTARDLCKLLKIPAGSYYLRLAQGRLPPASGRLGQAQYWLKEQVNQWLADRNGGAA